MDLVHASIRDGARGAGPAVHGGGRGRMAELSEAVNAQLAKPSHTVLAVVCALAVAAVLYFNKPSYVVYSDGDVSLLSVAALSAALVGAAFYAADALGVLA